jgi:hypothetical protein
VEEKYIQNEHLVDNTAEELVIVLESSDSDMSEEDEDNSLEGIFPLSPDSESSNDVDQRQENQSEYF